MASHANRLVKIHYGWIICGLCLMSNFLCVGLTVTGLSLHFPTIIAEYGLSKTQMSVVVTIRCVFTVIATSFANVYYKRFSLRHGVSWMGALLAVSYLGLSQAETAIDYYLMAALLGVVYALGSAVPISLLVHNWFLSLRPIAIAISMCGGSICAIITPPILTKVREKIGLQWTFSVEAVFIASVVLILFFFLRDRPEDIGASPYVRDTNKSIAQGKCKSLDRKTNISAGRLPLFFISSFLMGGASSSVMGSITIHYTHVGYTTALADTAMSAYGIALLCSKFLYSLFTSRFGGCSTEICFLALWALSIFMTAILDGNSVLLLILSAVLIGVGSASATVGVLDWTDKLSSDRTFARNTKYTQWCFSAGSVVVSIIPGIMADMTGSYFMAFLLIGLGLLSAILLMYLVYH